MPMFLSWSREILNPIALLDGKDGQSLHAWLKNNKYVKVVTRDRASAYAKVISEELPDAMQIADRFHLHQNLLEAVRNGTVQLLDKSSRLRYNMDERIVRLDEKMVRVNSVWV